MVYRRHNKFIKRLRLRSSRIGPGTQIWRGEDRISSLPDHLLYHILSFLTTEEAVWMSVLSSRWRYLWKWVPRLDLDTSDFPNDKTCADFIHKFLNFQSESYFREFMLSIDQDFKSDVSLYEPCLDAVIKMRKIHHFQVESHLENWNTEISLTLSVCEALVCLKLHIVRLNEFESLSLPSLKIMYLEDVIFPSDSAAEALISCSPVLQDLKISLSRNDVVLDLLVCSQSLKSFTLKREEPIYDQNGSHKVVIDTPILEYLTLLDFQFESFKIISMSDSAKIDLDIDFESDIYIIYNLLNKFSGVRDMTISWRTLKLTYNFYDVNPLPKFHALTCLRATMSSNAFLEVLPFVLESCPNLKHFTLELVNDKYYPMGVVSRLSTVLSHCFLETVELKSPVTEEATELNLVRYFLENSATLKKLVLRLTESCRENYEPGVLKQLFESPRRSSLCQLEVLPVVPNPTPWLVYVKTNRL